MKMKENPRLKTVKVTLGIQKRLERLKKGEFKRKYKTKSINDVIEKLLDAYDEYVILKEQQKGIVETGKIAKASIEGEIEEELPDVCPDCIECISCNSNAHGYPEEVKARGCFKPRNQCIFRTEAKKEGMIDCAKDFARTGKIHDVSKDFCDKCWERKKVFLSKMKKPISQQQEPKTEAVPKQEEEQVELPKTIECDNSIFRIEEPKHLLNLPCFVNPMFPCPNPECQKLLQKYMKYLGRSK